MNVLLVSPRTPDTFWSFRHALNFVSRRASIPPLGLLTVAAIRATGSKARVIVTEPMGSEMLLAVEQDGDRLVARVSADFPGRAGDRVWIHLPAERTHWFDGAGQRL